MTQQTYTVQNGDSYASIAGKLTGDQRNYLQLAQQQPGGLERELHPGDVVSWDDSQAQASPYISQQDWQRTPTGYSANGPQFNQQAPQPQQQPTDTSLVYNANGIGQHILTYPDGTQATKLLHINDANAYTADGVHVQPVHPSAVTPAGGSTQPTTPTTNPWDTGKPATVPPGWYTAPPNAQGRPVPNQPVVRPEFYKLPEWQQRLFWPAYLTDYGGWYVFNMGQGKLLADDWLIK